MLKIRPVGIFSFVKKRFKTLMFCFLSYPFFSFLSDDSTLKNLENQVINQDFAIKWAKMTLSFTKKQQSRTPTFISRTLGYIGLTMYESVVYSNSKYQSIASQLNGLENLPKPEGGKKYDWEIVLNAGQSKIIRILWKYEDSSYNTEVLIARLDSLENAILQTRTKVVKDTAIINRSIAFGVNLANKVFEWSMTDGGHQSHLRNFDPKYKLPKGDGFWIPPIRGQSPIRMALHPYWGNNRTFVKANAALPIAPMIPYSKDTASAYYQQFKQVYRIQKRLTQEQKEIANWWGDDPAFTTAPPGHSYNLAIILIKQQKVDLVTAAMTFAKVGMACADSFINCWKNKYYYHSERPTSFIWNNIDENFEQYWPEPPFPGFPSGHSTQMAATAEVLISIFGDNIAFVDDTHQGRPMDEERNVAYKNRHFSKISTIAEECGISRLYGGIHTMQDNLIGLAEGKKIGKNINQLHWR